MMIMRMRHSARSCFACGVACGVGRPAATTLSIRDVHRSGAKNARVPVRKCAAAAAAAPAADRLNGSFVVYVVRACATSIEAADFLASCSSLCDRVVAICTVNAARAKQLNTILIVAYYTSHAVLNSEGIIAKATYKPQ